MTEKKKIDLKKQDFKWSPTDVPSSGATSSDDISLSTLVESVNQQPLENLSPVAKDRKNQRGSIDSAVDMIPSSIKGDKGDVKSVVAKSRDDAKQNVVSAVDSIGLPSIENTSTDEASELALNLPSNSLEDNSKEFEVNQALNKKTQSDSNSEIKQKSKNKLSENGSEVEKFKGNIKELWKSILGVAILLVAIIIGITYKEPKPGNKQVPEPVELKQSGQTIPPSSVIDKDTTIANSENGASIIGDVVASENNVGVPILSFNDSGTKNIGNVIDSNLSLNNVLAIGNKSLSTISLAQWPNAVNLQEVPSSVEKIAALFPEHLYKRLDNFQESLVIYDKRSAEQEKFVRQSQSCYFFPSENNGSWMGVNFYMISYCFLNSQFIGLNIYTNNGPDVMKKIETNLSKYPYLHISSVQKLNGFNIVNIEQNQAYKILEDYRIQLLNSVISKK